MSYRVPLIITDVPGYREVFRLLVTANVLPSFQNLLTLRMEAIRSFETSVVTRATGRNIIEHGILHSHRRKSLKSDMLADCIDKVRATKSQRHVLLRALLQR
jgi:hypothetical protein